MTDENKKLGKNELSIDVPNDGNSPWSFLHDEGALDRLHKALSEISPDVLRRLFQASFEGESIKSSSRVVDVDSSSLEAPFKKTAFF